MSDHPPEASPWVRRWSSLIPPDGPILDLACGGGRHVRWFLDRGRHVVAVDKHLESLAELRHRDGLEAIEADLEGGRWPLARRTFGGVVVTNYLWRPLFPKLLAAVAPGGALLYETFGEGNAEFGRPTNPEYLLRPGELLELVAGTLTVVAYEHGVVRVPRPAVVQRIAAVFAPCGALEPGG